jgi:hypothetical protein
MMSGFEIIESKIQSGKAIFIKKKAKKAECLPASQETLDADALLDVFAMTQCAQREWENACAFFDMAAGQDLVEQAIHDLIAAEYKYGYFLKLAKAQNIRNGGVPL